MTLFSKIFEFFANAALGDAVCPTQGGRIVSFRGLTNPNRSHRLLHSPFLFNLLVF